MSSNFFKVSPALGPSDEVLDNQPPNGSVPEESAGALIPILICVCIVLGMLAVGLAPFGRPHNDVGWLANGNGLSLTGRSTILSQSAFSVTTSGKEAASTLEVWVQPGRMEVSATLLGFSVPE